MTTEMIPTGVELTLRTREEIAASLKEKFGKTLDDATLLLMADEQIWQMKGHSTPTFC